MNIKLFPSTDSLYVTFCLEAILLKLIPSTDSSDDNFCLEANDLPTRRVNESNVTFLPLSCHAVQRGSAITAPQVSAHLHGPWWPQSG